MRVRWQNFELPSRVVTDSESLSTTYGRFVIEPFEKGFGHTVGNGLRRVLLSSIEGAAVTRVKIDGVLHEFSTIDGVYEDIVDVILNVKGILLRLHNLGPVPLRIDVTKEGPVTARDIQCPADVEVLNPDHVICTLTSERSFRVELEAQRGRGYWTAEENEKEEPEVGAIAIDSNYSPVVRVRYKVEDTRVGKVTNYDRLILEIWTNGSVTPEAALIEAAKVYRKHLIPFVHYLQAGPTILTGYEQDTGSVSREQLGSEPEKDNGILDQPISILNLSVRARNCLDAENIRTIGQLIRMTESELMEVRNFGTTSLKEVKRKLGEHNLALSGSEVDREDDEESAVEPSTSAVINVSDEAEPES